MRSRRQSRPSQNHSRGVIRWFDDDVQVGGRGRRRRAAMMTSPESSLNLPASVTIMSSALGRARRRAAWKSVPAARPGPGPGTGPGHGIGTRMAVINLDNRVSCRLVVTARRRCQ